MTDSQEPQGPFLGLGDYGTHHPKAKVSCSRGPSRKVENQLGNDIMWRGGASRPRNY